MVVIDKCNHDFLLCAPALTYMCLVVETRILDYVAFRSNTAMYNVAEYSMQIHSQSHVNGWNLGYKVTVHIKYTK